MKANNKLLILTEDPVSYAQLIERLDIATPEVITCKTPGEVESCIEDCNIILGEPDRIVPVLGKSRCLEWIQSTYAGVDPLVAPSKHTDYVLTNVKGVFGPLMSEYIFAYILALERNILETHENQRDVRWQALPYRPLKGMLLGVCGLGSIGRHIARTADGFGMKVWGYKRFKEAVPGIDRVFTPTGFKKFLAHPDYIVVTLPLTPESFHLFDDEAFRAMKPSAVLMNVGRGPIVSEGALVRALKEKQIRGAVLDVFEQEPLSKDSPLWGLPNILITPHNSAVSFPEDVVPVFAENYRRFVAGKPLKYVVDLDRGY
jgi:phosphoglycerate dehydrogenase-like enzyme